MLCPTGELPPGLCCGAAAAAARGLPKLCAGTPVRQLAESGFSEAQCARRCLRRSPLLRDLGLQAACSDPCSSATCSGCRPRTPGQQSLVACYLSSVACPHATYKSNVSPNSTSGCIKETFAAKNNMSSWKARLPRCLTKTENFVFVKVLHRAQRKHHRSWDERARLPRPSHQSPGCGSGTQVGEEKYFSLYPSRFLAETPLPPQ